MLIFPAIDILGGKVVRLYQGDYARREVYGEDPAAFARLFLEQGAAWLHMVDLDGAKAGEPKNLEPARRAAAVEGLKCEMGGGIRSQAAAERCFEAGIERVILGTAALRDAAFTRMMVERYAERIAVGVDARDGRVAVQGWTETSSADSIAFCRQMREIGVKYIIYTDISRDGTQSGPNLEVYRRLVRIDGLNIIASGGVGKIEDITALRDIGIYGAIVGKAIYTGSVNLGQAVAMAR